MCSFSNDRPWLTSYEIMSRSIVLHFNSLHSLILFILLTMALDYYLLQLKRLLISSSHVASRQNKRIYAQNVLKRAVHFVNIICVFISHAN